MKYLLIQLNDLPDEILTYILKKLDNGQVLYSLTGVNKWLNTLVHDRIFTSHLRLMRYISDDSISPLSDTILDYFCLEILPLIHYKIQWLDIKSSSMERILLSTTYPNLYRLGLYNLEIEEAKHLFAMERGECHIYSYPYQLKEYDQITNNFPGGNLKYVREISPFDERPFEHEFFFQISQSSPFMKKLTLINEKPQYNKQYRKLDDDKQHSSIIKYSHLSHLNLDDAYDDYIEQFLTDTKTCLPNNIYLSVDYQVLKRVTQDFTRNTTRINCTKLRSLGLIGMCEIPKYVKEYFPHTRIFFDCY